MGQLTDLGSSQAAQLGRELKMRYPTLLDPAGSTLEARSTNVARCMATLSAVLGSMLPEGGEAVHVTTLENSNEYLTPNAKACERVGYFMHEGKRRWVDSTHSHSTQALHTQLKGTVSNEQFEFLGLDKMNFVRFRDWVVARKAHGLGLAWDLDAAQVEVLDRLGAEQVAVYVGWKQPDEETVIRAAIGRALGEIIKKAQKGERKLYLVSAHDTTVLPLLIALEVFDGNWPKYCADLAFELWEDHSYSGNQEADRFQLRVLYNGDEVVRMPLAEFEAKYRNKVPRDWAATCRLRPNEKAALDASGGGSHF